MEDKKSSKQQQWEGETRVDLQNTTPSQIWPLISNFCTFHKWAPHIKTCYLLHGLPGHPGTIRYCSTTTTTNKPCDDDHDTAQWATERLLSIDPFNMCFSYEVVDSNVGFKGYVATIRLEELHDDHYRGGRGCRIVWSFVTDPVDGFTLEGFLGFIESIAKVMANRMEDALLRGEARVLDSLDSL
ncbi:hypothetical protein vseg_005710 [Gypsophila vaccaria]